MTSEQEERLVKAVEGIAGMLESILISYTRDNDLQDIAAALHGLDDKLGDLTKAVEEKDAA